MSHANAATQQVPSYGLLGRLNLLRRPVVHTPSGPILERRRKPRAVVFAHSGAAPLAATDDGMPRVCITRPLDTLPPGIPPRESFVLSRLSTAAIPLDELLALCPHPPIEVLRILDRWAAAGLVILV